MNIAAVDSYAESTWTSSTGVGRWSTLGPYYAMFPVDFVRRTVLAMCPDGGALLDPFCGRGTVPYVAKAMGSASLGIDLNPVAYVFAAAKTDPEPSVEAVLARIDDIAESIRRSDRVPENDFQAWAWHPRALEFLRAARRVLDWRDSRLDRTLMAIILVHLHGKRGNAISNQMRQTKGMGPAYAVQWWRSRAMRPPDIDPVAYFSAKTSWRYRRGIIQGPSARIVLGDARDVLPRARQKFSMLLTSPPYCGVTNYRVDNWIRLWMLGDAPQPNWEISQRYANKGKYHDLLTDVFRSSKRVLDTDAVIYVRTDAREFTLDATVAALQECWPERRMLAQHGRGMRSQTTHYGDQSMKPGEVDILLPAADTLIPEGFTPIRELRTACEGKHQRRFWTPAKAGPDTLVDELTC